MVLQPSCVRTWWGEVVLQPSCVRTWWGEVVLQPSCMRTWWGEVVLQPSGVRIWWGEVVLQPSCVRTWWGEVQAGQALVVMQGHGDDLQGHVRDTRKAEPGGVGGARQAMRWCQGWGGQGRPRAGVRGGGGKAGHALVSGVGCVHLHA